jgi:RNA polymerase sigma-70 factor (ECF subfamily)
MTLAGHRGARQKDGAMMQERCAPTRTLDSEEWATIEGCKRGEHAAFDRLVRAYEDRVYRFAYGLCPRYDDASDVSADTFVRVFRAIHHFRGNANFSTWLFRIVINVYLDRRKKERRSQHLSLQDYTDLDDVNLVRQIEDPSPTPERIVEDHERRDALQDAIASLPDYQRAVIVLYHTEGKTYNEIAEVLSLPVGTVKSRLNRTRLNLRARLSSAEMFP